jgi:hypothetical protein
MKVGPIYFINPFGFFSQPVIWSKLEYWTLVIISTIMGIVLYLSWISNIGDFTLFLIMIPLYSAFWFYTFIKGRQKAELYKWQLAARGLRR